MSGDDNAKEKEEKSFRMVGGRSFKEVQLENMTFQGQLGRQDAGGSQPKSPREGAIEGVPERSRGCRLFAITLVEGEELEALNNRE